MNSYRSEFLQKWCRLFPQESSVMVAGVSRTANRGTLEE